MHKFNFRKYKIKSMSLLWFQWINGKYYCLYWDWGGNIWWYPRFQKEKYAWRIGWLYGAVGFGWKVIDRMKQD